MPGSISLLMPTFMKKSPATLIAFCPDICHLQQSENILTMLVDPHRPFNPKSFNFRDTFLITENITEHMTSIQLEITETDASTNSTVITYQWQLVGLSYGRDGARIIIWLMRPNRAFFFWHSHSTTYIFSIYSKVKFSDISLYYA
jgi:hypothetical protein